MMTKIKTAHVDTAATETIWIDEGGDIPQTAIDAFDEVNAPDGGATLAEALQSEIRKLTTADIENHRGLVTPTDQSYAALADVLNDAFLQAAIGKGHERHANGKAFTQQPILEIPRMQTTIDGQLYQVMKKAQEAGRMSVTGQHDAAERELFGVINYAAAAIIRNRELAAE